MTLVDDAPRVVEALRAINGVTVGTTWPKAEIRQPYVLITLAGDRSADNRDDQRYLTELEYYIRVFTDKAEAMRRVCNAVHAAMEALGYVLTFRWEEPGEGRRQTALRYRIYM